MPAPGPAPASSTARYGVRTIWDAGIVVRDGVRLSANLWLPEPRPESPDERIPAVLEMIPYGKDNWRRNADIARGEWLAARGFALCRLDVRGTGSSGGIALDEYTADETRDGYEAVEWLAAQPWCSGDVAMWGISYGGFTAIQVAALRPPHLRAIVPVMATDDRYRDDVHYRGGCLTASEQSQYAVSQVAMNAMPPDPAFRGPDWRDDWLARLRATPPWTLEWLRQQVDGPYWRGGSLAPDYGAIEAAILGVGGWMDSYVDPAFRMQERCTAAAERVLVVGPWSHDLPDSARPGPRLDWPGELVGFLDRHLRGAGTTEGPPPVRWFERTWTPPVAFPERLEGRWRAAATYPPPGVVPRWWRFAGGTVPMAGALLEVDGSDGSPTTEQGVDEVRHRATVGTAAALSWGSGEAPNGLGRDLRPDESWSLVYTSSPLDEPVSVLGVPEAVLHVSADASIATVVVRLTDVAPDGTSGQVSAGVLNLTHRRSDSAPEPLVPGRIEEVRVPLRTAGYRWPAGHRIRVTVATQYWPVIWPSPLPVTLSVHRGGATPSRIELPTIQLEDATPLDPRFVRGPGPNDERTVGGGTDEPPEWRIEEDVLAGTVTVRIAEAGTTELEDGRSLYTSERLAMTAAHEDPAHARLDNDVVYRWRERDFETTIRATGATASDEASFTFDLHLEVEVDGDPFFARDWHEVIPRHLV